MSGGSFLILAKDVPFSVKEGHNIDSSLKINEYIEEGNEKLQNGFSNDLSDINSIKLDVKS